MSCSPVTTAIDQEHAEYAARQKQGAGIQHGPPGYQFIARVDVLPAEPVGQQHQQRLKELSEKLMNTEMTDVDMVASQVHPEDMYDHSMCRLIIGMQHLPERQLIIKSLQQLSVRRMVDTPPQPATRRTGFPR